MGGTDGLGVSELGIEKSEDATRRRERAVLFVLAAVQFTSIVDFMLVMPLGPQLMEQLGLSTTQFALIVSSYTFAAGAAGLVAAAVIERFGRKDAFLTVFVGFLLGTLCCGLAWSYPTLLAARVLTGAFGGVLGGMALAIIGDVFPGHRHGQATGALMSAFSAASVFGVPFGLAVGVAYGWQKPFLILAGLGTIVLVVAVRALPPLREHLEHRREVHPLREIWTALSLPNHLRAFALMSSLMLAGFVVVPFLATYMVKNVGVGESRLALGYIVGGLLTIVSSPVIGKLADRLGRLRVFLVVVPFSALMMIVATSLPRAPLALAISVMGVFMVGMSGRMVPAMAMILGSIEPRRRGSFMSVNSSVQHISAAIGAYVGGLIVVDAADGSLLHYSRVGWLAAAMSAVALVTAALIRPLPMARPMTPAMCLGAADQAVGDPGDPLAAVEAL
ncbi:MAG TPA: MFS transporter [Isosphaeraceae bacterium]